jgi:probable HAF family extracellular repeat protein
MKMDNPLVPHRRSFLPRLETLEDRTVPSGYAFTTIDYPNGEFSVATGINARGQVVGYYFDSNFKQHAFLFSGGQYTTLNDPNGRPVDSVGEINDQGQIVGDYFDPNGGHGFLLSRGQYTTLDNPNAVYGTVAEGINTAGQIVGIFFDSHFTRHGFLFNGGQYTTLDDPNAGTGFVQGTIAASINASGMIVGSYLDSGDVGHGFLLSGGQYTTLDDPDASLGRPPSGTAAEGINDRGQIIGEYYDANYNIHGFLLSGGKYTTLDDPNTEILTVPQGINNSGQIVGVYIGTDFQLHSFLATPVPDKFAGAASLAVPPGSVPSNPLANQAPSSVLGSTVSAAVQGLSSESRAAFLSPLALLGLPVSTTYPAFAAATPSFPAPQIGWGGNSISINEDQGGETRGVPGYRSIMAGMVTISTGHDETSSLFDFNGPMADGKQPLA